MISMKFASFLSFSHLSSVDFYGFYGFLNLYFSPKVSLHFWKFLRHESVKQASKIYQFISKWPNIGKYDCFNGKNTKSSEIEGTHYFD